MPLPYTLPFILGPEPEPQPAYELGSSQAVSVIAQEAAESSAELQNTTAQAVITEA